MKTNYQLQQLQRSGETQQMPDQMTKFINYIDLLLESNSTQIQYPLAFNTVYNLTKDHKETEMLNLIEQKLVAFLSRNYSRLQLHDNPTSLLHILEEAITIVTRVCEICLFLDTNYCEKLKHPLKKRLEEIVFKSICREVKVLQITASGVFAAREGNHLQCNPLLTFIGNLDQKQQFFERFLLSYYQPLLQRHYEIISKNEWQKRSLLDYLQWAKGELERELAFGKQLLSKKKGQEGLESIQNSIYTKIVLAYKSRIYEADEEELFEKLTLPILELFRFGKNKEVEGHIQWFMTRIEARLNTIPTTENATFLAAFSTLYHRVAALLKDTQGKFEINYRAVFTFEEWINNQKFNVPMRLNILLDAHLRSLQLGRSIESVILVFKLVKEKNLFENLYRRMLLARLVHFYRDYKLEEELRIIQLMEAECGDEWTKKINSIYQLFLKNRTAFADQKIYSGKLLPVIVEENDWPFEHKQTKIALHHQLTELTPAFEASYLPANKNHRLLWSPKVGTVTLSIKFKDCSRTVIVSVEAANILLSIQSKPIQLSSYLCETGYKIDEVENAIQVLNKSKLLLSTSKGSDFVLELVNEYAAGGEIDLVTNLEQGEIEVKAMEELKADRKLMVEAIIVKLMKSEKMARRDELVHKTAPLLAQRGFHFNAEFVEKSIDRLLDKEFLRDFQDGTLGYIA